MVEYDTSSKSSGPYAIWVDIYDNVWFSLTGIYKVGKFDQATQELHEYDLPSPQTHIKFIHTEDNGNVWFPNYNNNKIGVILADTPAMPEESAAPVVDAEPENEEEDSAEMPRTELEIPAVDPSTETPKVEQIITSEDQPLGLPIIGLAVAVGVIGIIAAIVIFVRKRTILKKSNN